MLNRRLATTGKHTHAADGNAPLNATVCGLRLAPITAKIEGNVECNKCANAIRVQAGALKELLTGYYE